MRNSFTIEAIKQTPTYRLLNENNKLVKCSLLESRNVREKITHAYLVHKNTGHIPNTVEGFYLDVVKDFINLDNIEVDYEK